MTQGQTIILHGESQRRFGKQLIDQAPQGAVLNIKKAKRTTDQNAKMWAMLSDVSRAKPEGRCCTPDTWKLVFMQALKHEIQFEIGLDGKPFPIGHSTSKLNKSQMADLIEVIYEYGSRNGVQFTGPDDLEAAA